MYRLSEVNRWTRPQFVEALGEIFEHSPWIAAAAWDARPFADVEALHAAMGAVLADADDTAKLELMRAHPWLAGKQARTQALTSFSGQEQAGAGLDGCTAEEAEELTSMNARYQEKFGFPCIIAVKGLDKHRIFEILARRLQYGRQREFAENVQQILNIARSRLDAMLAAG